MEPWLSQRTLAQLMTAACETLCVDAEGLTLTEQADVCYGMVVPRE